MAINTRLTQNIDLQADGGTLVKALGSMEQALNSIIGKAGLLSKELDKGGKAGQAGFNSQLKQINMLIGQAQNLTKILDAQKNQKASKLFDGLDVQALGKKGAAASRLAQDLTETSRASEVLEKRIATLNKRFAEMTLAGRTVGQKDLTKQLKTQEALKDIQGLERAFQRLNGQAGSGKGTVEQRAQMAGLRSEIEKANAELVKMGQGRRIDFTPQINQIRSLTDQYRLAVNAAVAFDRAQPGRSQNANRLAVSTLNQSDAQRLAQIKSASSQFAFPTGISQNVSQRGAEAQMAASLEKRLRLLNMIQAAQDRGAPTRSVERLNEAYKKLALQLGENFKLLTQVNSEVARQQKGSFMGQVQAGLGRVGIIAGASVAVTGVYAVMNAFKDAAKFVVEYEAALKQLQAISGSTDQQMTRLSTSIGEVGRNSTYSLLEITKAATVIAQAGYSAQETGDVLKSAVTLSTASGSSPTESVEVLTSALGAFQLQASEAGRVVDTLVTGLNQSKLSMTQMGQAIQYAGATANESGVKLEELTAIAASLANAGIKSGSTIGTGLRQLLVDMKTPTEDFKKALKDVGLTVADVDVRAKGFAEVVKTLANAGFTAEAAYASFETRAASAFLAFKGQIGTYDQLALAIARGGSAAAAQEKSMDSLSAQFNRLKNDLMVVVAALAGPFLDSLKVITASFAFVIEGITDIGAALSRGTGEVAYFGDALKLVAFTMAGFAVGGPIGAAIGAFISLTGSIGSAGSELDELRTKTTDAQAKFNSQAETITNLDQSIEGLIDRQGTLKGNSVALQTETVTLGERFQDLYQYLGKTTASYDELLNAMLRYRGEALKQQKYEAETLKTNAEIELNATRGRLNSNNSVRGFAVGLDKSRAQSELGNYSGGVNSVVDQAMASTDLGKVTTARNYIARLSASDNGGLKTVLKLLEERLTDIKQVAALQSQVQVAEQQIGIADEASSPEATRRTRNLGRIRGGTNAALARFNAGDAGALSPAIANATDAVNYLKQRVAATKEGSAQFAVLSSDLSKAESELARLVTAQREKDEADSKIKPTRAAKGLNLTGTQVKSSILSKFAPGANVYSEKPRSMATQQKLYADYKAGKGPLAAKPGTSNHGSGHAIDVTPIAGKSIDELASYIEGLGLEVTERLNERDPKTGRYHWHVAWKAKTSSFEKTQDAANTKALNELDSLKNAVAGKAVSASQSKIAALLAQGKAGNSSDLSAKLETAISEYSAASLNQYDTAHPATGLTGDAAKIQQMGRDDVVEKIKNDAEKWRADMYRAIGDQITKTFDNAMTALENALKNESYDAEAPLRAAKSRQTVAGSRLNKDKNDAGTSYYLQQQSEAAELNADRAKLAAQNKYQAGALQNIDDLTYNVGKLPEGEDKTAKLEKIKQAQDALNQSMRESAELQQSINERTSNFIALPLEDRVNGAIAAWADNSGVMKDWTTVMVDAVGPALDMMTSSLSNVFEGLAKGTMSVKSALKSVLSSIGDFVVQMIAKALALQAVKWLLSLAGFQMVDTVGGVGVTRKMQGGLVEGDTPKSSFPDPFRQVGKKMQGGPLGLLGGGSTGYITEGVINKDTVPILGARGEYMLRSAAVKDIGVENIDAMNKHGAKAVSRMAGAVPVGGNNHQEMSVYVIKPDEKPQLGPRDIVLAITDDMLQGGTTKQLVKSISQGAM